MEEAGWGTSLGIPWLSGVKAWGWRDSASPWSSAALCPGGQEAVQMRQRLGPPCSAHLVPAERAAAPRLLMWGCHQDVSERQEVFQRACGIKEALHCRHVDHRAQRGRVVTGETQLRKNEIFSPNAIGHIFKLWGLSRNHSK